MKNVKLIFNYLLKFKKDLTITIGLIVVETIFELIIPFLMKDIIDKGIEYKDMKQIVISGVLIIVCAIVSLITGNFYARSNAKLVANVSYSLRRDIYTKIEAFSFSNLDNYKTASLVTRVTNDVNIIQNTLAGGIRPLCRSPLMLLMGVGLSFMMEPRLAWIFVACVPILGLILYLIVKTTAPKYSYLQENVDGLNLIVRENVSSIRTVKAYVREDYEEEKFDNANQTVSTTTKKTFRIAQLNQPSFQFVMYAVTVLILGFGSALIHNSNLKVGTLSALLSYISQVVNSLMMISNTFLLLNRSFASCKRLNEVLTEESSIVSLANRVSINSGKVDFNNVSFKYKKSGKENVLSDINLHIEDGESIGILGGTGSSKSTLVSLILRLYDVTQGEVLVDNVNVKEYDLKHLRDNVSIVLQNNVLFTGTIKENLLWGNKNATKEEIDEALKTACAYDFVYDTLGGLDYDLGQGGVNLSGGQRQRLCIARALLKKPKILILDDSTSACDMETERTIMSYLRHLKGLTTIVIAQRISSVMDSNRIIIMDDGKINAIGNHDELLKSNNIYKELYDAQIGGMGYGNN